MYVYTRVNTYFFLFLRLRSCPCSPKPQAYGSVSGVLNHLDLCWSYAMDCWQASLELDREVEELGGLVTTWASNGLMFWVDLPVGVKTQPFSYRKCHCFQCAWGLGRSPMTATDVIRHYQQVHFWDRNDVHAFAPPPLTCQKAHSYPDHMYASHDGTVCRGYYHYR